MLFAWSNKEVDGKACGMYCGEVKYMGWGVLVRKPEWKRPLGRHITRVGDNIKKEL
jgi:hypothetical protein